MNVDLKIPPEPIEVKNFILAVQSRLGKNNTVNWDSTAVWAGNKVPQYLWSYWRNELTKKGFTWQKFLMLMKYRTDDAILWANNRITWGEFANKILGAIEGPFGKALLER
jgi:hypothetical protein